MTGGAGHIMDMNNRMKQNRSMKTSKKEKFKSHSRDVIHSDEKKTKWNIRRISKVRLDKIRRRIKEKAIWEQKKEKLVFAFVALIVILSVFYFFK